MAYEVEHSFASFIPKEGLADCIANEDGERQIACAVSFHGEEKVKRCTGAIVAWEFEGTLGS